MSGPEGNFPRLTVVYDGECNLCLATVDKLKRMPVRAQLRYVPLQQLIDGQIGPWPGIGGVTPRQLSAQLHVTDEQGRRFSGSDAVMKLLGLTPGLTWLARLGGLPGLRVISRMLYRIVARYRYRLFGKTSCSDGVCSLPRPVSSDGGQHESSQP
jgi:predicted DCC family thiol-disulfide oxidoreductase YuxK